MRSLLMALVYVSAISPAQAESGTYDWSGAYAGTQAGYGWGQAQADYLNPAVYGASLDPDGMLGGVYAGYSHHLSRNFVLGIDADIAWSGADAGFKELSPATMDFGAVDISYSAALRARLGFAADRFLAYIAGGPAISRARFTYDMTSEDASIPSTLTGWTLGAGLDYAATNNLILRIEYRYSDFGAGRKNAFPSFPTHQARYELKTQELRVGLALKF